MLWAVVKGLNRLQSTGSTGWALESSGLNCSVGGAWATAAATRLLFR